MRRRLDFTFSFMILFPLCHQLKSGFKRVRYVGNNVRKSLEVDRLVSCSITFKSDVNTSPGALALTSAFPLGV